MGNMTHLRVQAIITNKERRREKKQSALGGPPRVRDATRPSMRREHFERVAAGPGVETPGHDRVGRRACAASRMAGSRWRSTRSGAIDRTFGRRTTVWPPLSGGQGAGFEPTTAKFQAWCSNLLS